MSRSVRSEKEGLEMRRRGGPGEDGGGSGRGYWTGAILPVFKGWVLVAMSGCTFLVVGQCQIRKNSMLR